jgi:hypothetical protein
VGSGQWAEEEWAEEEWAVGSEEWAGESAPSLFGGVVAGFSDASGVFTGPLLLFELSSAFSAHCSPVALWGDSVTTATESFLQSFR